jgi:hypothetical protein
MPPHPHPEARPATRHVTTPAPLPAARLADEAAARPRAAVPRVATPRALTLPRPAPPTSASSPLVPRHAARPSLRVRSAAGQASVELVASLPVIVLILAFGWQAVWAGQAIWNARVAARAAARAHAVGADAERAARDHLPRRLERGLRVSPRPSGSVRVSIRVPSVLPSLGLGRVGATSHFRPQS